jgi:hypothetical protein
VFSLVAHKQLKEKKSEAIKGTCTVNYMADGIQAMEKKRSRMFWTMATRVVQFQSSASVGGPKSSTPRKLSEVVTHQKIPGLPARTLLRVHLSRTRRIVTSSTTSAASTTFG